MVWLSKALLVSFLIMQTVASSEAQSAPLNCKDLLPKEGAVRYVDQNGSSHTATLDKQFFCSDSFLDYAKSSHTSGSADVPIDGIKVGSAFDTQNADHMRARQVFCADSQKTFTEDQTQYMAVKEGDSVLVAGYLQCAALQAQHQSVLEVSSESHSTGLFEVKIMSRPYIDAHPLVISSKAIAGASEVDMSSLVPGTSIPLDGEGRSPLVGTFKFDPGSTEAAVQVKTTIGDQVVTVKKCPSGSAGSFHVDYETTEQIVVPSGTFTQQWQVPPAGCNPHCHEDQGDWHYQTFSAPGSILRNASIVCEPGRSECAFDEWHVQQTDESTLNASARSRSVGLVFNITADKFKREAKTTMNKTGEHAIYYDSSFSVYLPKGSDSQIEISGSEGEARLTSAALTQNLSFSWLKQLGTPQMVRNGAVYTFIVSSPSCH